MVRLAEDSGSCQGSFGVEGRVGQNARSESSLWQAVSSSSGRHGTPSPLVQEPPRSKDILYR